MAEDALKSCKALLKDRPRDPGLRYLTARVERLVGNTNRGTFLLAVREQHVDEVTARFAARSLACAAIGTVDASREAIVEQGGEAALLWDFQDAPFIVAPQADAR